MKKTESGITRLFDEMLNKGLISTGNFWIETAIKQKNAKLPIAIANSRFLSFDQIDRKIITLDKSN